MTTVSVEEFRSQVDQYLALAAAGEVVLTQQGKPWIVLQGVPSGATADSAAFARSQEFWQMIQQRRAEQGIPWEEAKKSLNLQED